MSALVLQVMNLIADALVFIFVGYFFIEYKNREQDLKKKENKVDADYHQVVDTALSKERKILEDATSEADKIITDAKVLNADSKELVNQALQKMVVAMQQEVTDEANNFLKSYQVSIQQLSMQSIYNYQSITKGLEIDLQKIADDLKVNLVNISNGLQADLAKQINEFHTTLLPAMQKELDEYKNIRFKQADKTINEVIQRVGVELLNKSITVEDHKTLMVEALEKAKKEGVFD